MSVQVHRRATGQETATVTPIRPEVSAATTGEEDIDALLAEFPIDSLTERLKSAIESYIVEAFMKRNLTPMRPPEDPFGAIYLARLSPDPIVKSDVARLKQHRSVADLSAELRFEDEWEDQLLYEREAHDPNVLRQGDILKDIDLLGAIHLAAINHHVPLTDGQPTAWTVNRQPIIGFAMVLSHCCEIDLDNDVKMTSIILSPIRDVSTATRDEKIAELKASNLIDALNPEASYLKYFYLEPALELSFGGGAVADFSKCFSVQKKSYKYLRSRKVLQLDDRVRLSMSLKLGLYFHRAGTNA